VRYLLWAVLGFLSLGIQGSISFFTVAPNLTVILACYAGIHGGEHKGLFYGSLVGMIEDSLSGALLGPGLLSKGLAGYLAAVLSGKLLVWTPFAGVVTLAALTIFDGFAVYLTRCLFHAKPSGIVAAAVAIMTQALLNLPFGIILKKKTKT